MEGVRVKFNKIIEHLFCTWPCMRDMLSPTLEEPARLDTDDLFVLLCREVAETRFTTGFK